MYLVFGTQNHKQISEFHITVRRTTIFIIIIINQNGYKNNLSQMSRVNKHLINEHCVNKYNISILCFRCTHFTAGKRVEKVVLLYQRTRQHTYVSFDTDYNIYLCV